MGERWCNQADGLAEGLADGPADGLADGLAEGLADGLAEGLADGLALGLADGAELKLGSAVPTIGALDGAAEGLVVGADNMAASFFFRSMVASASFAFFFISSERMSCELDISNLRLK